MGVHNWIKSSGSPRIQSVCTDLRFSNLILPFGIFPSFWSDPIFDETDVLCFSHVIPSINSSLLDTTVITYFGGLTQSLFPSLMEHLSGNNKKIVIEMDIKLIQKFYWNSKLSLFDFLAVLRFLFLVIFSQQKQSKLELQLRQEYYNLLCEKNFYLQFQS